MSEYFVSKLGQFVGANEYLFVSDVISFLGWLNVTLLLLAGALFTLRRINRYGFHNRNGFIRKIVKLLRTLHPYIGVLLLLSAYIHGDLALGTIFTIHTGSLVLLIVVVMMLVATAGRKYRMKLWMKIHRTLALALFVAGFLHLFARNLL